MADHSSIESSARKPPKATKGLSQGKVPQEVSWGGPRDRNCHFDCAVGVSAPNDADCRLGSLERSLQAMARARAHCGRICAYRDAERVTRCLERVSAAQHGFTLFLLFCRSWWTAMFETSVAVPALRFAIQDQDAFFA